MQALIEATPVPRHVAERMVRRIVHHWVFDSDEKMAPSAYVPYWRGGGDGDGAIELPPTLRRRSNGGSQADYM